MEKKCRYNLNDFPFEIMFFHNSDFVVLAEDGYDSCNDAMKSPVPDLVRSQGLYLFEVNPYRLSGLSIKLLVYTSVILNLLGMWM